MTWSVFDAVRYQLDAPKVSEELFLSRFSRFNSVAALLTSYRSCRLSRTIAPAHFAYSPDKLLSEIDLETPFSKTSDRRPHRYLACLSLPMAEDDRRPKRSRFDQTEPEPRRSRFDRRSRSPSGRQSESTRTRSPLSRDAGSPAADSPRKATPTDPAAAAGMSGAIIILLMSSIANHSNSSTAAAAAKINAQLQAKKGIQHADVPPIRTVNPN